MRARDLKTGDVFKASPDLIVRVDVVCILHNSMVGLKVTDLKTGERLHLPPLPATLEIAIESGVEND